MVEETENGEEIPVKKSKLPLLIGVVLALVGGGGGFFAVQSGILFGDHSEEADAGHATPAASMPAVTFVPVDPLVINLDSKGKNRFLRFRAQLEVDGTQEEEVRTLLPRVVDVMNGYLRAVGVDDLERPGALVKLRAQMLRRIRIVTGEGRVRDLLIMEFVLN
jgi:flagellar FliL protein